MLEFLLWVKFFSFKEEKKNENDIIFKIIKKKPKRKITLMK